MSVDLSFWFFIVFLVALGLFWIYSIVRRRTIAARQPSDMADWAETLHDAGRPDEAIDLIGRELDRSRGNIISSADRLRHISLLRLMAHQLHLMGRLAEAVPYAAEAADSADKLAERHPRHAISPSLTLGLLLSGLGDDRGAVYRFRQARRHIVVSFAMYPLDSSLDVERVHVHANLAMALRRAGVGDEALALARETVELARRVAYAKFPPYVEGSAGWAHGALALTLTDAGQDGREAAADALAVWQGLTDRGVYEPVNEGLAASLFFMGYALRPFDPGPAAGFARRAVDMLGRIEAQHPGRCARRLAEAETLAADLAGADQP
ncbi:hypothetical protein CS0771_62750 [Catellatospora sp. IY07-71]|uniref:hypothetical protein n=1 Tax=Catellatospora sp. IY07-71 TaxID=2728827 RepID=UPI001BB429F7|nr:hypothetical protein [Catellatospora sp. IY07-71]BCJ76731.1 hypothetical protein CS0771_62750 [Catellatospora sp. IY07-71]